MRALLSYYVPAKFVTAKCEVTFLHFDVCRSDEIYMRYCPHGIISYYHLIISHHNALGDFGNFNYYIRTCFSSDEDVTKLDFNDFLNIFIVRTHYLSIYLFLY